MRLRTLALVVALLAVMSAMKPAFGESFQGNKPIDRYQLAVVVANLLTKSGSVQMAKVTPSGLKDLDPAYELAVAVCVSNGILQGFDGKFFGKKPLNRYQIAVVAAKLAKSFQEEGPEGTAGEQALPADVPPTHWAAASIRMARPLIPLVNGKFEGRQLASRYDVATCVGRLPVLGAIPVEGEPVAYDDVPADHPAARHVKECARLGLFHIGDGLRAPARSKAREDAFVSAEEFQRLEKMPTVVADTFARLSVMKSTLEDVADDGVQNPAVIGKELTSLKAGCASLRTQIDEALERLVRVDKSAGEAIRSSAADVEAVLTSMKRSLGRLEADLPDLEKKLSSR